MAEAEIYRIWFETRVTVTKFKVTKTLELYADYCKFYQETVKEPGAQPTLYGAWASWLTQDGHRSFRKRFGSKMRMVRLLTLNN